MQSEWTIEEGLAIATHNEYTITLQPSTIQAFKDLIISMRKNHSMLVGDQINNVPAGLEAGLVLRVQAKHKPEAMLFMAAMPGEPPMTVESLTEANSPAEMLKHYTTPESFSTTPRKSKPTDTNGKSTTE